MAIARREMTLEEFLTLPEQKPALEFEDGVILEKVTPKPRHGFIQAAIARLIDNVAVERRLARSATEMRFSVGRRSYVPDVSVYHWERLCIDRNGELSNDFVEPPNIAVEIVSPGQLVNALVRRCLWYTEHGVELTLLVDPGDKSILAFRQDQAPRALTGSDLIDFGEILPGFELTVVQIMQSLRLD